MLLSSTLRTIPGESTGGILANGRERWQIDASLKENPDAMPSENRHHETRRMSHTPTNLEATV
jgi:hypothetical protein